MAISAGEARAKLSPLIQQVNDDHEPVEITSKGGNAVLMSADDYRSWQETVYLLRSPAKPRASWPPSPRTRRPRPPPVCRAPAVAPRKTEPISTAALGGQSACGMHRVSATDDAVRRNEREWRKKPRQG